jgi:uncharacterized protein
MAGASDGRRVKYDEARKPLCVEVVYALPHRQVLLKLEVLEGTTVAGAIARSGILERFPGLSLVPGRVGVFGRLMDPEAPVRDGDRIEIYRPLIADPKEARRKRAEMPGRRNRR